MAFTGPPSLAPPLPGEDGRINAQVTIELGRVALYVLGILGVAVAGVDKIYINLGTVAVSVPAGGVFTLTFKTPFPKSCLATVAVASFGTHLKWTGQNQGGATFQRNDGAAGAGTVSFIAIGC